MGSGIAGSLFSMGNLATAIYDLDTIPAGADGSEALDLGALSPSNLVSSAGLSELESFSGYSASTLRDYGATDETVVKFLNPDIDGDGVYDFEQGLDWQFRVDYWFDVPWDYIDFPARSVRYDLSQYQRQSYEIKYWRGLDARAPQEAVRLTAHPEDGSPSFDIPCQYGWFPSYLDAEYYFVLEPTNGLAPPFDGDFELHLGAIRHSFSDMRFISTRDDHEGLLLCVYELRAGPDDSFKELAFDWLRRTSGAWVEADPAEVKLRLKELNFSFQFSDGTLYLAHYSTSEPAWRLDHINESTNLVLSSAPTAGDPMHAGRTVSLQGTGRRRVSDVTKFRTDYHDIADNVYAFFRN